MVGWLDIIVLAIVEGVTEFLPVSSTGHMIIVSNLLELPESKQLEAFLVIVQSGAILAVITACWPTLLRWIRGWIAFFGSSKGNAEHISERQQSLFVLMAVVPFAVIGFSLRNVIKSLFSTNVVAYALIFGGILMLISEFIHSRRKTPERTSSKMGFVDALFIGFGQCCALWPGFSRSAATIIAGQARGFSRGTAAELSFLVGLPTLLGTAGYETLKSWNHLTSDWLQFLAVGILVSWVVAYICVKSFIAFLKRFPLSVFAYYRILIGFFLLWYFNYK